MAHLFLISKGKKYNFAAVTSIETAFSICETSEFNPIVQRGELWVVDHYSHRYSHRWAQRHHSDCTTETL